MNLVSPKFSDAKAKEYIDWQQSLGCDHVHLLLVNQGDGEGSGYDCLADAGHKAVALARVRDIRARGLGVVAWVVADDSDGYRRKIFDNPARYADALKEYFPYLSYIVLGLEMNEGEVRSRSGRRSATQSERPGGADRSRRTTRPVTATTPRSAR